MSHKKPAFLDHDLTKNLKLDDESFHARSMATMSVHELGFRVDVGVQSGELSPRAFLDRGTGTDVLVLAARF